MPEPQRLPLAVKPSNRDETTDRDAKILNGYVERVSENDIEEGDWEGLRRALPYAVGLILGTCVVLVVVAIQMQMVVQLGKPMWKLDMQVFKILVEVVLTDTDLQILHGVDHLQ